MRRWILIILCLMISCGSAAYLIMYGKDKVETECDFRQIRDDSLDLSGLYEQNHDLIGWIRIDGTRIDYPVMQTPDDPEYYLYRDFNKEYSSSGTPFLDARSDITVTWDWTIYGHNMKFGTMFHDLHKYASKAFWENHRTFSFDVYDSKKGTTNHEMYEIFAVCRSKIQTGDSDSFKYYQYAGCTDEDAFDEYVIGVMAESIYDTGIMPECDDQLITLSTCAYHTEQGRFYVVGKRIRGGTEIGN